MLKQIYGYKKQQIRTLSSQFGFEIPPYQRPYDWDTEQANQADSQEQETK